MAKHNLEALDAMRFAGLVKRREEAVSLGDGELRWEYNANRLARLMHPEKQWLTVSEITEHKGAKTFRLVPCQEKGTRQCAYFTAGQYISVVVSVNGRRYSRPYSLSSSPEESIKGYYLITVKAVKGGIVSNHILCNWKVGTEVEVSAPMGSFTYEPLRDAAHIVAIAGGSGVTPFLSLAKAICDNDEECSLTLLYGSRTQEDILFEEELNRLSEADERIRTVFVLSEERREGTEHGFITAEIIQRYAPDSDYSVFLCGPKPMMEFADKELEKLSIEKRRIRHEVHGEIVSPRGFDDYTAVKEKQVKLSVWLRGERITLYADPELTLLRSLEQGGVAPPSGCRSGECGFCRTKLLSGRVYIPENSDKRRRADESFGYIHPCCSYPLEDLELEITAK